MKGKTLLKEVIRYQWYDVLFDRFYTHEHSSLPVNDLWQDTAFRITFNWGLCAGGGICVLLFLLTLRFVRSLWLIPVILLFIALAFIFSSFFSCIYLFCRIKRHYKDEAYAQRMEMEDIGELHGEQSEATDPKQSGDPPNMP